jgi:hypothetical protein
MGRLRRAVRVGGWAAAAGAVLAAAGIVAPDRHVGLGRLGVGVARGQTEVVWASHDVVWERPAWKFGTGMRVNVGPLRRALPSRLSMGMGMGGPAGTVNHTMTAVYVPLFNVAVVLAGAAGVMLWWGRPGFGPGQCGRCGYDVLGLEVCPECGTGRG